MLSLPPSRMLSGVRRRLIQGKSGSVTVSWSSARPGVRICGGRDMRPAGQPETSSQGVLTRRRPSAVQPGSNSGDVAGVAVTACATGTRTPTARLKSNLLFLAWLKGREVILGEDPLRGRSIHLCKGLLRQCRQTTRPLTSLLFD